MRLLCRARKRGYSYALSFYRLTIRSKQNLKKSKRGYCILR
jgi:hypothetical protein